MSRIAYSQTPGEQFGHSTFRTEKSVEGLPSGSDREKEQALPEGSATPKSVSKDGQPADKGQGAGQRALPYGQFNGPASGSGTPEKSRTKGVPGEQYGSPSKDDYGMITRRTMTAAEEAESDLIAAYRAWPMGKRRHRQPMKTRLKRRRRYRNRRPRELQRARRNYRTRYKRNPAFKRRRKLCRQNPNRCKMLRNPAKKQAATGIPDVEFLYGCKLDAGYIESITPEGLIACVLDDGREFTISATAFVSTAVFLDEHDIDVVDYLVESSDAEEPYGEPTHDDVVAAAGMHNVPVPDIADPEEALAAVFDSVMSGCSDRVAHDTFQYDKTPAAELSNNWMNRKEPTREVADTRPYKENAPGQWTRDRKDQTHTPGDGGYVDPNPTSYGGGSGKVIPDEMRKINAAWGPVLRRWDQ